MTEKEKSRLEYMLQFESAAIEAGYRLIGGIDEAGRGPLAGPVVAACVILSVGFMPEGLNDSKKVSAKKRDLLFDIIKNGAVSFGVGVVDEKEIDEINILNATKKAMESAVAAMKVTPDVLLIDALKLEKIKLPQKSIIKGDTLSLSIAAASIIAKVTRDRLLIEFDQHYPEYGFAGHKGYGCAKHIEAIRQHGLCPIHRRSFTRNFV